jgi:MFS family permease
MLGTVRVAVPESRRMVALYVAAAASFAALSARGLTVPLYAHDLGANRFEVGALFSVSTLAAALLSLPSGVLVDCFGARSLLSISFLLAGASQLATAATPSFSRCSCGRWSVDWRPEHSRLRCSAQSRNPPPAAAWDASWGG